MVATAPAPQDIPTSPHSSPHSSPPPSASGIAPKPQNDDTRQTFAAMSGRIKNSPYFSQEIRELLEQKLKGQDTNNQYRAGLGGAVDAAGMAKMLDTLEGLAKKQPPLTTEHIQAIFLAGFVKGGVQGVLNFVNSPTNAQYLEKSGFDAMKALLESDYKRSILFVKNQTSYLQNTLSPLLDGIFGKKDLLSTWQQQVQEEDERVSRGTLAPGEAWDPRMLPEGSLEVGPNDISPAARPRMGRNNPHFLVPAGCFHYSWHVATAMTGKTAQNSSDRSLQGRSLMSLATAGLKPGDVVYISKNPGSDPQSMNLSNLPHWAVVVGYKNGEPVLSDNWDETITLSGWTKKYGAAGRRVDEIWRNA